MVKSIPSRINNLGKIYTEMVSKSDGELDTDYINSIQKPPEWIIKRAMDKFKNFHTQAEIQEMLVGVAMTPDGVKIGQNDSISKTKWRPTYVPEEVLDDAINNQTFGNEQLVALKIGYRQFFESLGKFSGAYHNDKKACNSK